MSRNLFSLHVKTEFMSEICSLFMLKLNSYQETCSVYMLKLNSCQETCSDYIKTEFMPRTGSVK